MSIASKQTEVKYLKTGRRGMLPYPAGEWTAEATYTATENVAPYVLRNGTYYVMNKVGSVKGLDPQTDYGTNGQQATWIPFEEYKAVYVELLMARLGLIGKSVFWDNYTFSQKGVDDKGQPSDQYQNFEAGTFTPNILIDWVEGTIKLLKLVAEGADISGTIKAKLGNIGRFLIDSDGLSGSDSAGNEVRITPDEFFLKRVIKYAVWELARYEMRMGGSGGASQNDPNSMIAFDIYRHANNTTPETRYAPAFRVVSDNSANSNVGLRVDGGAIIAEQGVLERVCAFNSHTDFNLLPVDRGGCFMVYNEQNTTIYLPNREELCRVFGKNWQTDWVTARITVASHRSSPQEFTLSFQSSDSGTFYDHNGNAFTPKLSKGDAFEFFLVSEPTLYWALEVNANE